MAYLRFELPRWHFQKLASAPPVSAAVGNIPPPLPRGPPVQCSRGEAGASSAIPHRPVDLINIINTKRCGSPKCQSQCCVKQFRTRFRGVRIFTLESETPFPVSVKNFRTHLRRVRNFSIGVRNVGPSVVYNSFGLVSGTKY